MIKYPQLRRQFKEDTNTIPKNECTMLLIKDLTIMPVLEAPSVELGSAPPTPSIIASPSPSEISSASSPEPQNVHVTPLFRMLAMPPPGPEQPPGQEELERRLPGYRRIVIPRESTLIELLKESSGVTTDEEVLTIREAKLRVIAERVGLRRLHVLAPHLRSLTLDGSAISSLRDLGIGLVHLKNLSINRCSLTSLDGIWGLSALRELHAAANRLSELHPLAAMQKLQTLNLADNPIEESSRLWTIGVCSSLRRLTLRGTPISNTMNYRSLVASVLPMLVSLDDIPLNPDEEAMRVPSAPWSEKSLQQTQPDEIPEEILSDSSEHDNAGSDTETDKLNDQYRPLLNEVVAMEESQPGPSNISQLKSSNNSTKELTFKRSRLSRLRPATTECAGIRPARPDLPHRPRTAIERPIDAPTRLKIMNTLMDDEWRCSGSNLTSHDPVCGNLARALRRSPKEKLRSSMEAELEIMGNTMAEACRALAAEIPRVPNAEQWARFKEETGIDIDIDFNARPKDADPSKVLERLERIEKETMERLNANPNDIPDVITPYTLDPSRTLSRGIMSDYELWREIEDLDITPPPDNVDDLFRDISLIRPRHRRISEND